MDTLYLVSIIIYSGIKNAIFFYRNRKQGVDVFSFIFWTLFTFSYIWAGTFTFKIAYDNLILVLPTAKQYLSAAPLIAPYIADFAAYLILRKHTIPPDFAGKLLFNFFSTIVFFSVIGSMAFVLFAGFWAVIILANIFHWNIAGYKY